MLPTEWQAIYNDGTTLPQYNEDGSENRYTDINRDTLTQFILFRYTRPKLVIHLDSHKKLIYRMRRAENDRGVQEVVYLVGWQEKRNGYNIQSISSLFEDDHIEVVDRFNEKHPWFYSINFIEEERI